MPFYSTQKSCCIVSGPLFSQNNHAAEFYAVTAAADQVGLWRYPQICELNKESVGKQSLDSGYNRKIATPNVQGNEDINKYDIIISFVPTPLPTQTGIFSELWACCCCCCCIVSPS
ncbi:hypothetical protein LIER_00168 [Lithospermum erythrorhizon]|uniref:Uncharacterized protein n=1 Tax=Lithospermum erythrorhizon TaxID=34254 RepID=A0AAV3NHY5_LITER